MSSSSRWNGPSPLLAVLWFVPGPPDVRTSYEPCAIQLDSYDVSGSSAEEGMEQGEAEGGGGAGGGEGEDPGGHDGAGHAPAHGGDATGRAGAHDRRGDHVGGRDRRLVEERRG